MCPLHKCLLSCLCASIFLHKTEIISELCVLMLFLGEAKGIFYFLLHSFCIFIFLKGIDSLYKLSEICFKSTIPKLIMMQLFKNL
jgi:hypothetical protein